MISSELRYYTNDKKSCMIAALRTIKEFYYKIQEDCHEYTISLWFCRKLFASAFLKRSKKTVWGWNHLKARAGKSWGCLHWRFDCKTKNSRLPYNHRWGISPRNMAFRFLLGVQRSWSHQDKNRIAISWWGSYDRWYIPDRKDFLQ